MARMLTIGAAQSGPISRQETRADVVERLLLLMREAARQECELIVFTECALTAFFPHWYMDNQSEIDSYFEREMPSAETQPLFDEARRLRIGFQLGYAELVEEDGQTRHYNSSILVDRDGQLIGQFRKIHLPIMTPAIISAFLLVFIEVVKELPASLLLRPFDFETLATYVFQFASDEQLEHAASGALLIIIVSLLPILLLKKKKKMH